MKEVNFEVPNDAVEELSPYQPRLFSILEDYESPLKAFNEVAGQLLTQAAKKGVVNFNVNDLRMIEATAAINQVGAYLDENDEPEWENMFNLINEAWSHRDFHNGGPFEIEAQEKDGEVKVWWPN